MNIKYIYIGNLGQIIITNYYNNENTEDYIGKYDLECPYHIYKLLSNEDINIQSVVEKMITCGVNKDKIKIALDCYKETLENKLIECFCGSDILK